MMLVLMYGALGFSALSFCMGRLPLKQKSIQTHTNGISNYIIQSPLGLPYSIFDRK